LREIKIGAIKPQQKRSGDIIASHG